MKTISQEIWDALRQDFADLFDADLLTHLTVRLLFAAIAGGLLGWEREKMGKAAGLRTHMLVCLGAALFVLIPQQAGMSVTDLSRVIQGLATGIGFIGAGTILKLGEEKRIVGLTTAANIWLTSAIGMTIGLGRLGGAILGTVLAIIILAVLGKIEHWREDSTV